MTARNPPILNTAIEDALAHVVTEEDRYQILRTLLHLTVEYLARETGRAATVGSLMAEEEFVMSAKPASPWPR